MTDTTQNPSAELQSQGSGDGVAVCSHARLRYLIEHYLTAYNRRDIDQIAALFNADDRYFEYFEYFAGQPTSIKDAQSWRDYLRTRFSLNDHLSPRPGHGINFLVEDGPRQEAHAALELTRSWGQYTGRTHLKAVCNGGLLIRAVIYTELT
jgi:ketosteroid isomerase-like protein